MEENYRNFLLAMALSILVLFAWQAFFVHPEAERQRQEAVQQAQNKPAEQQPQEPAAPGTPPPGAQAPASSPATPALAPRHRDRGFAACADRDAKPRGLDRSEGRPPR